MNKDKIHNIFLTQLTYHHFHVVPMKLNIILTGLAALSHQNVPLTARNT